MDPDYLMIKLMRSAAGHFFFSHFCGVAIVLLKIKIKGLISLEGICVTATGFVGVPRSLVSFPREPHVSSHSGPWALSLKELPKGFYLFLPGGENKKKKEKKLWVFFHPRLFTELIKKTE